MRLMPLALLGALGLGACASTPMASSPAPASIPSSATPTMGSSTSTMQRAIVNLAGASGSLVSGKLTLVPAGNGVRISGDIGGLAPGSSHGFHIHETGDCSAADAASAGSHFNPGGTAHGKAETAPHHAGDIDNIVADPSGVAHVDSRVAGVALGGGGGTDIVGRAFIVHAVPDDYRTQPSGNSGARIACGVVTLP